MPSSHRHLLGMQLREWDLYVPAILTKLYSIHDILQPACETGSFLTHWMPAQGISSTKPQKPPHLCLPSLGGGRILETLRYRDWRTIWCPTQYLWLSVLYQWLQKAFFTHTMPHGSPVFLLNRLFLYQVAIHCCLISASCSYIYTLSFSLNFFAITYTPGHLSSLALLPSPSSPPATASLPLPSTCWVSTCLRT